MNHISQPYNSNEQQDRYHAIFLMNIARLDQIEIKRLEQYVSDGGGVVFFRSIKGLDTVMLEGDAGTGVNIIRRALEEPLRQISANAGHEGAIIVQKVAGKTGSFGFNARSEDFEDLVKAGITDAAKVSRTAMENGASIASLLLTTEALVAEIPEEKPPAPAGPPGGDMY